MRNTGEVALYEKARVIEVTNIDRPGAQQIAIFDHL